MQFNATNYVQLTCRCNQYRNLGSSGFTTSDKSFLGFILEIQQKNVFFFAHRTEQVACQIQKH